MEQLCGRRCSNSFIGHEAPKLNGLFGAKQKRDRSVKYFRQSERRTNQARKQQSFKQLGQRDPLTSLAVASISCGCGCVSCIMICFLPRGRKERKAKSMSNMFPLSQHCHNTVQQRTLATVLKTSRMLTSYFECLNTSRIQIQIPECN